MREGIFAVLLALAGGLVVAGIVHFSTGAAFVVAGLLLALWSWLLLSGGR